MDKTQQYERVFYHFDIDKDGKISPGELRQCVAAVGGSMSQDEAEAAVMWADADGDGLLGLPEFVALVEGDRSSGDDEERLEELKEAFRMYSEKGYNLITVKSLKRMLSRIGYKRSMEECGVMVSMFDLNGDGVLSFDEFMVMMS